MEQECGGNIRSIMNTKITYNDDDARYTDAPPEVDAALDYAIEHNLFLTRQQFFDLLESNKQEILRPQSKTHYASARPKVTVMA